MGIETMYSVNVSQVATVSFEGVISDIGSKDPLSFATVQLLHGDEVHSVLSKDNGVVSFPSVHPGDYILRITYVGYDRYEKRVTLKRDTKLTVKMAPSGNSLNEIVVTARESQGLVSSSKINREMMTHLQPTSFSDLLELLPYTTLFRSGQFHTVERNGNAEFIGRTIFQSRLCHYIVGNSFFSRWSSS